MPVSNAGRAESLVLLVIANLLAGSCCSRSAVTPHRVARYIIIALIRPTWARSNLSAHSFDQASRKSVSRRCRVRGCSFGFPVHFRFPLEDDPASFGKRA